MPAYFDERTKTWRYRFRHEGKRYSGTAPASSNTKKGAEAAERRHREKIEKRRFTGEVPTVAAFAKRFLEYQETHTKPLTYVSNESVVRVHIVPHLGSLKLDEVGAAELAALKTAWSTGGEKGEPPPANDRTINTRLGVVKRIFALALEWELIDRAPTTKNLKIPDETPFWLDDANSARLIEGARKYDELGIPHEKGRKTKRKKTGLLWTSMVIVALRTGLRIGELRGLQWIDIDFVRRALHVRRTDPGRAGFDATSPKSNKERIVPLTEDTAAELARWKAMQGSPAPDALVFPGATSWKAERGRARSRGEGTCADAMGYIAFYAGFGADSEITWHTCRHTYASQLVARGIHLRRVQALLGHHSISQTEVYAHLAPSSVDHDAVATLDFALVGAPRSDSRAIDQQTANKRDLLPEKTSE